MPKLQIQSILYNNDPFAVERAVDAIRSAIGVLADRRDWKVVVYYGDCSPKPCLSEANQAAFAAILDGYAEFRYVFFDSNLGSAAGHNRLADRAHDGFILVQNPDIIGEASYLGELTACFTDPDCGMAEGRQLPIEHPKDYDPLTGETGWATTACAMIPVDLFRQLNGFDERTFFLYCDDVDFSWRVRLAGRKVIFQPSAVVFHDKRLSPQAGWLPSGAEQYYSIEAALMMAHKWSNPERVRHLLSMCDSIDEGVFSKAAAEYRLREKEGRLPSPIDPDHTVATFLGDLYAPHRFAL